MRNIFHDYLFFKKFIIKFVIKIIVNNLTIIQPKNFVFLNKNDNFAE